MDQVASEFYQNHLDRVSRSFAFCIRQLPEPLKSWIGLSYLLCRLVDTIEDSPWNAIGEQQSAFQIFDASLVNASCCRDLEGWESRFPRDLPEGERLLLMDAARLMRDFHEFPASVHEIIRELVLSMSQGMQHFAIQRAGGDLRLGTLAEVNQYCFFVAGVVGELLAKLVSKVEPKFRLSQMSLLRAHHFGLFLQKVNLLKDQVGDEKVGRHLIPSRELVESSSRENAARALDFLLDVPKEQLEFRRFCAWSLFLGLEALNVARGSILRQAVLKVPRQDMEGLLERVEGALEDDVALRDLYASRIQSLGWSMETSRGGQVGQELPKWFVSLYRGPLDSSSLCDLGVAAFN